MMTNKADGKVLESHSHHLYRCQGFKLQRPIRYLITIENGGHEGLIPRVSHIYERMVTLKLAPKIASSRS
jgi:hypothetical protein